MRQARVYRNGELVGYITEHDRRNYSFVYEDTWYTNNRKPAVSLTLPKTQKEYKSEFLFPFFFNMLSEGVNKRLQSTLLRIDEEDSFGLLLATAQSDTIGAVTIKQNEQSANE
jgi:serine/threonine-protein kinase HipA